MVVWLVRVRYEMRWGFLLIRFCREEIKFCFFRLNPHLVSGGGLVLVDGFHNLARL